MARHDRFVPAARAMARDADEDPVRDIGDDDEDDEFEDVEEEELDEDDDLDSDIVDEELKRDTRPTAEVGSEGGSPGNRVRSRPHAGRTEGSEATRTGRPSGRDR